MIGALGANYALCEKGFRRGLSGAKLNGVLVGSIHTGLDKCVKEPSTSGIGSVAPTLSKTDVARALGVNSTWEAKR